MDEKVKAELDAIHIALFNLSALMSVKFPEDRIDDFLKNAAEGQSEVPNNEATVDLLNEMAKWAEKSRNMI